MIGLHHCSKHGEPNMVKNSSKMTIPGFQAAPNTHSMGSMFSQYAKCVKSTNLVLLPHNKNILSNYSTVLCTTRILELITAQNI